MLCDNKLFVFVYFSMKRYNPMSQVMYHRVKLELKKPLLIIFVLKFYDKALKMYRDSSGLTLKTLL